jgi:HAD superfamily phosphoserine phosphatase-like hydrolase
MGHNFICYSEPYQGLDFAFKLTDALVSGPQPFTIWIDKLNLASYVGDWDVAIEAAIRTCDCLIFIMTPDSVEDQSVCKNEWSHALKYHKPIIPVKLHSDAELPFLLGNRQLIDFTEPFEAALDRLRTSLGWLASPEGRLQTMRERLTELKRELRRTKGDRAQGLRLEMADLESRMAGVQEAINHPAAAIEKARQGASSPAPPDTRGLVLQPGPEWVSPVRRNRLRYKVAAFDFDGTLLRGEGFEFSWEAVWRSLGFGKKIQSDLKREYRKRIIAEPSREGRVQSYQDWCDKACAQFKLRKLTRSQLKEMSGALTLTRNCREALSQLRGQGVVVAIISGGIDTFLEDCFPDFRDYADFVFINELVFGADDLLEGVRASAYDFQGKAEALDLVSARVGCTAAEVVFVGDHFNDADIMVKVDKAIAYPPQDTIIRDVAHEIITVDDLLAVVPCILVE